MLKRLSSKLYAQSKSFRIGLVINAIRKELRSCNCRKSRFTSSVVSVDDT